MVVIAGSFDQDQVGMGRFQEWNQVNKKERESIDMKMKGMIEIGREDMSDSGETKRSVNILTYNKQFGKSVKNHINVLKYRNYNYKNFLLYNMKYTGMIIELLMLSL